MAIQGGGMSKPTFESFEIERPVVYRGETYWVREGGAVYRMRREGQGKRSLDEIWTYGRAHRSSKYMFIASHSVHRIVAHAFHGDPPSPEHVVDHIDTNRMNNRSDNLRWVTRLENILLNPISRRRIELAYGSLEAFWADPESPKYPSHLRGFSWMRNVTASEAQTCLNNLLRWASSDSGHAGGRLGGWIHGVSSGKPDSIEIYSESLTPVAIQKNWRVPCEFPACPGELAGEPIKVYRQNLAHGAVFSRGADYYSTVYELSLSSNGASLSVLCQNHGKLVKQWAVALVSQEAGKMCHNSCGSFFTLEGAQKQHFRNIGREDLVRSIGECIDDYC